MCFRYSGDTFDVILFMIIICVYWCYHLNKITINAHQKINEIEIIIIQEVRGLYFLGLDRE